MKRSLTDEELTAAMDLIKSSNKDKDIISGHTKKNVEVNTVESTIKVIGRVIIFLFMCLVWAIAINSTFFTLKANLTGKPVTYNFLRAKSIFIPYDHGYKNPGWHPIAQKGMAWQEVKTPNAK